jgi:transposase
LSVCQSSLCLRLEPTLPDYPAGQQPSCHQQRSCSKRQRPTRERHRPTGRRKRRGRSRSRRAGVLVLRSSSRSSGGGREVVEALVDLRNGDVLLLGYLSHHCRVVPPTAAMSTSPPLLAGGGRKRADDVLADSVEDDLVALVDEKGQCRLLRCTSPTARLDVRGAPHEAPPLLLDRPLRRGVGDTPTTRARSSARRQTTGPPDPRALGRDLLRGEGRMRLAPASTRFPYSRQTAYHYFRAWRIDGTWERIHTTVRERTRLREGRQASPSAAILDPQSVRTTEKGGRGDTTGPRR